MAMNKAERAALEAALTETALRWPTEAEPQPMTREDIKAALVEVQCKDQSCYKTRKIAKGWFFNSYSAEVGPAWSDGMSHGLRNWTGDNASQRMGEIYRTKREALLALRWTKCREIAKQLRAIDLRMAEDTTHD